MKSVVDLTFQFSPLPFLPANLLFPISSDPLPVVVPHFPWSQTHARYEVHIYARIRLYPALEIRDVMTIGRIPTCSLFRPQFTRLSTMRPHEHHAGKGNVK